MTKISDFSPDVRKAARKTTSYDDFVPKGQGILVTEKQKGFFVKYFEQKTKRHDAYLRNKVKIQLQKRTPESMLKHRLASRQYRARVKARKLRQRKS